MRYLLLFSLIGISSNVYYSQSVAPRVPQPETLSAKSLLAGAFIDVNTASYDASGYDPEQLVKDILISGGVSECTAAVSNVTVTPNQSATNANRFWGYFNRGTTNFPFKDGIVLVTGHASETGNTANSGMNNSVAGSPGSDSDLASATDTTQSSMNDAVVLEFDFVPVTNQVKFNYIFASEEYTSTYPCGGFADPFALLIKPVGGSTYTNLAVLPNGNGAVKVTNIVPASFFCGPINAEYFDTPTLNSNIETNFNGRAIPMTAVANVIPGQAYHFKLALADMVDGSYDTGVFLEGGSFDLGTLNFVDENNAILPNEFYLCEGSSKSMTVQVNIVNGMVFQWLKDGDIIPGATSPTYVATEAGVYKVLISVPGNQCPVSANITVLKGELPTTEISASSLTVCPGDSVTLTASGGASYNWVGLPGDGNTQTVSPTEETTYTVYAISDLGCISAEPATITLNYHHSSEMIRQHFSDTIFFDNTGGNYVSWEWYKDGVLVSSAGNKPYYSEPGVPLNGIYYVVATDINGNIVQSCPLTLTGQSVVSGGISIVPNPVQPGSQVTVVSSFDASLLQNATMYVVDMSGNLLQTLTNVQPQMTITAPQAKGIYVIALYLSTGQKATVNLLVK